MTSIRTILLGCLLASSSYLFAQSSDFSYQNPLTQVFRPDWYELVLPPEVLTRIRTDAGDLRLYQVTATDTTKVPYLLRIARQVEPEATQVEVLNIKQQKNGAFITLRQEAPGAIQKLALDLAPATFEVRATLEGSHNRLLWTTLRSDLRLLGIDRGGFQYRYTTVDLPETDYEFLRVRFDDPGVRILGAEAFPPPPEPGEMREYVLADRDIRNDTQAKTTTVTLALMQRVPVTAIELRLAGEQDFFRPVFGEMATRLTRPDSSVVLDWKPWTREVLSSLEGPVVRGPLRFAREIRLTIENFDDLPLNIEGVQVRGPVYSLIARLDTAGETYLRYGAPNLTPPRYDLKYFQDQIPEEPLPASLGAAEVLRPSDEAEDEPGAGQSRDWLTWLILGVVVVIGGLTVVMIRRMGGNKPD